ncbi:hypothetical protein ACFQMA_14240 [Halosimplex aquaticum]|uniref:Uncharacterized protein n=1 Tax=Halosimplex aquaticum TaxID=3026162 RepID=A0ABD5Y6N3_9EURY|nr:hypothetical protein [Halosimplex aquaticum]
MSGVLGLPTWVVALAVVSAVVALAYFLLRGLRDDHATGQYHFTWGVGVVALFLMGFAPGLVGLGLYLAVECGYPVYWLLGLVVAALLVVTALSYGVDVSTAAAVAPTAPPHIQG